MRLIDADGLKSVRSIQTADFNSIESIQRWIDNAPTIDPADNGGCWGCQCALLGQAPSKVSIVEVTELGRKRSLPIIEGEKPEILIPEPITKAAVKLGEDLGDFINSVIEYLYEKEGSNGTV